MRRLVPVILMLAACGTPLAAQTTTPAPASEPPVESGIQVLPRFDFEVSLAHLISEEIRYVWDAQFGGDIDLVSVDRTRLSFVATYQTILGNEFRAFDPNQGNYTLEGVLTTRVSGVEVAGMFHHVSRHLSDRPKRFPVDWNMVGGRIAAQGRRDRMSYEGRADLRGVILHTYVDYRWELDSEATIRVRILPRMALTTTGAWRVVGVDESRGRNTQRGFRGEGGVRLAGRDATVDFFVAAEQRIDPYQLEFSTVRWLTAGFRISSPRPSGVP